MISMKLSYQEYGLKLKHRFTISRISRDAVPVVLLRLEQDGIVAFGEASPNARYGETSETVTAFLNRVDISQLSDPIQLETVVDYLDSVADGNPSAKAAIDIAIHDVISKRLGVPLFRYFGCDKKKLPTSSYTIGIDKFNIVKEKVLEAANYPILKIKMGFAGDEEIIRAVREVTDKPIRVDANEGWKSRDEALEKIRWLTTQNVELIEQPMPAAQLHDIRWLRERVAIPIIADEALESIEDIANISTAYDGINVKVQKVGGLLKSKRIIEAARTHGMKIMIGCMIESSIGITAAAHLAPLADWIDLDGNVLINNDPFVGVMNVNGKLVLNEKPGLGVIRRPLPDNLRQDYR